MQLSSTAKTLLLNRNGWRNDDLFDNVNKPFLDVLSYEVEELGNTDILSFVFDYYFEKEYKNKRLGYFTSLYKHYLDCGKDVDVLLETSEHDIVFKFINNYFCDKLGIWNNSNIYCKWFTTQHGYSKVYKTVGESYELCQYLFPEKFLIVSDLGIDGCMVVSNEPFVFVKSKLY